MTQLTVRLTTPRRLLVGNLPPDCKSPYLTKRQKKMCSRDSGMPTVLRQALDLSIFECQDRFRNERWNCSVHNTAHRVNLLKKGMRETAFLYAISSAGLTYSVAKACSQGNMERCSCDTSYYSEETNRDTWKWGGCGDNLKYSQKFVERFLMPKKGDLPRSRDVRAKIDRHNTNLGIRVVEESARKVCKCHGVSGSCTSETCWHQLNRLQETGKLLKAIYDRAVMVELANTAHGANELVRHVKRRRKPPKRTPATPLTNSPVVSRSGPGKHDLVYIDRSPDFCEASPYTMGTRGRQCDKDWNCGSICCGRGYNIRSVLVTKRCECRFQWCCEVICKECIAREELHLCK
ncbi:protein Wnt-9a-like isoform X2 [Asterias rubens]|uniref:protein Wnt-9a-like isoform X2 n=1 Tax=Asterias rubens TaxID=7604 RepID=UPI0014556704|nr:protein Wnt-9a-like isoform X2 [Asterias rubens]